MRKTAKPRDDPHAEAEARLDALIREHPRGIDIVLHELVTGVRVQPGDGTPVPGYLSVPAAQLALLEWAKDSGRFDLVAYEPGGARDWVVEWSHGDEDFRERDASLARAVARAALKKGRRLRLDREAAAAKSPPVEKR